MSATMDARMKKVVLYNPQAVFWALPASPKLQL